MLKNFPCAKFLFFLGVIAVAVVVAVCLMPIEQLPLPSFYGVDKIEHFLTYLVLSFYFCQLLVRRWYFYSAFLLVMLGILIEVLQSFTGYRMFDFWDIVANSFGAAVGYYVGKSYGTILQSSCRRIGC